MLWWLTENELLTDFVKYTEIIMEKDTTKNSKTKKSLGIILLILTVSHMDCLNKCSQNGKTIYCVEANILQNDIYI